MCNVVGISDLYNVKCYGIFSAATPKQASMQRKGQAVPGCVKNASSCSLICKAPRWHLPDSRAVDESSLLVCLQTAIHLLRASSTPLHPSVSAFDQPPWPAGGPVQFGARRVPDRLRSRPVLRRGVLQLTGGLNHHH